MGLDLGLERDQEQGDDQEDEGSITASADGTAFTQGGVTYKVITCLVFCLGNPEIGNLPRAPAPWLAHPA